MATGRPGGRGGGVRGTPRALRAVRRDVPAANGTATDGDGAGEAPAAVRASARIGERAEAFLAADPLLADLREQSVAEGVVAIAPATAAALTFLATSTRARAVVEIGTGLGVGTVALLRGMPADGLLTSIDTDGGRQARARAGCG